MKTVDFNQLAVFKLETGAHDDPAKGVCAMEAVAWLEGLPHSDAPDCTCRVIAAYVRRLNDGLPTGERQRLVAYLPRLVGTVAPEFDQARGAYLAWQAVTIFAPNALRAAGKHGQATALENLPPHDFRTARTLIKSWGYPVYAAYASAAAYVSADAFAASAAADAFAAADAAEDAEDAAEDAARAAEDAARAAAAALRARGSGGGVGAPPQTSSSAAPSAASAAAAAAKAAKEPRTRWSPAFDALDGVLAIGPASAGFTPDVATQVAAFRRVLAGAEA